MMLSDWLIVVGVLSFLFRAFFFSGSEPAMTASSRGTMLQLAKDGNRDASIVTRLLENRQRLIGALLIGSNVAPIVSSALATALLQEWFGDLGVLYASIAMTVLVILFCEMLPKTAAINAPDRYAISIARPLDRVIRILGPVLDAADWLVRRMLAMAGIVPGAGEPLLPGHERLRGAVDLLHREGSVEKQDRDMLGGLLDLAGLRVGDVMIHRTEVITGDAGEPPEKVVEVVLKELVTRVPLWRGSPENIIGILHVKDLLRAIQAAGGDPKKVDIMALARPAWFVPEIRPLTEQLKAFRRRRTPLAIAFHGFRFQVLRRTRNRLEALRITPVALKAAAKAS